MNTTLHQPKDNSPTESSTPPTFLTDHLALASYLVSRSYEAVLTETGSGRILFGFAQTAGLEQDVAAFNEGTARVEPATYDAARISLRRRMDALKGGGR
jgi:hypothetical protein